MRKTPRTLGIIGRAVGGAAFGFTLAELVLREAPRVPVLKAGAWLLMLAVVILFLATLDWGDEPKGGR